MHVNALLLCLVFHQTAAQSGALVWQGFGYEWLHHIGPFETAHRLGSFASRLTNQSIAAVPDQKDAWNVTAQFYSALSV
jgi:hypothetical protein